MLGAYVRDTRLTHKSAYHFAEQKSAEANSLLRPLGMRHSSSIATAFRARSPLRHASVLKLQFIPLEMGKIIVDPVTAA